MRNHASLLPMRYQSNRDRWNDSSWGFRLLQPPLRAIPKHRLFKSFDNPACRRPASEVIHRSCPDCPVMVKHLPRFSRCKHRSSSLESVQRNIESGSHTHANCGHMHSPQTSAGRCGHGREDLRPAVGTRLSIIDFQRCGSMEIILRNHLNKIA